MHFYSIQMVLFVAVLFVLYYTVCRRKQWVLLLVASAAFYMYFGQLFGLLVAVTSFTVWAGGMILTKLTADYKKARKAEGITREEKKALKKKLTFKKRWVLLGELLINLGILGFFKYGGLYFEGFIFPLGISFYTFQALSYLFDIYNDKYEADANFFHFLLFVSWFPQMLQGPISRFNELGVQFFEEHKFDFEGVKRSLLLFAFGCMKKYAIADVLAKSITAIFGAGMSGQSGSTIFWGTVLGTIQQYADFSGGIDMVLAISGLFGIAVKDNFRQPYFAVTLADLWRRWHISLCDWARDYIYYPFAVTKPMMKLVKWGSKHWGKVGRLLPAMIGNLVVFALVGIWHGTGWNYFIWGVYNGVLMSLSDLMKPLFKKMTELLHINRKAFWFRCFRIVRTWILIGFGTIFTLFEKVGDSMLAFQSMLLRPDWKMIGIASILKKNLYNDSKLVPVFASLAFLIMIIRSVMKEKGIDVYEKLMSINLVFRWLIIYCVMFLTVAAFMYMNGEGGFMYANF